MRRRNSEGAHGEFSFLYVFESSHFPHDKELALRVGSAQEDPNEENGEISIGHLTTEDRHPQKMVVRLRDKNLDLDLDLEKSRDWANLDLDF